MAGFKDLIAQLCLDLEIETAKPDSDGICRIGIEEGAELFAADLDPGVRLNMPIGLCPEKKREDLFSYLMRANFLGQGTRGARIGLTADEKSLTLSQGFSYELNYRDFKAHVEDFINHGIYWREEIAKFEREP